MTVVVEAPVDVLTLTGRVREARARGDDLQVRVPGADAPAVRRFVAAARALAEVPTGADVVVTGTTSFLAVAILAEALGGTRPWRVDGRRGQAALLSLAGVPVVLRQGAALRLALSHPDGELVLGGGHLTWRATDGGVTALDDLVPTEPSPLPVQAALALCAVHDALSVPTAPVRPVPGLPVALGRLRRRPREAPAAVVPAVVDAVRAVADRPVDPGWAPAAALLDATGRAGAGRLLAGAADPTTPDAEVLAALGVAPRHAWLVRRWLAAGAAPATTPARPDVGPSLDAAYAALGFPAVMARVHRACLAALPRLLRDEVDLTELLLTADGVLPALEAYQTNAITGALHEAAAGVVQALPGPLRVLEVGAGTGVATRTVGAVAGEYLVTDVAPHLVEHLRRHTPGTAFAVLDVDHDLVAQGAPTDLDVVLAANVLHNAVDVPAALTRLRAVLRPGGLLVVLDSVRDTPAALTGLMFLLSGGPPRTDGRRDELFPGRGTWRAAFHAAGVVPVAELPAPGHGLDLLGQFLLVGVAA